MAAFPSWWGYARDTLIAHNQIDHIPYAAISIGWGGWPDKIRQAGQANHSEGNVISDNRIDDLMLVLADGGGISTQGLTGPDLAHGEKVTGNVVEDQFGSGHAIYTDNGSSMIAVSGNVMFHTNMDNWGSRHHDYYDGQDGRNFDPLAIKDNYWQQGDPDSSDRNVTVSGNRLIASLAEVPNTVLSDAGLEAPWKQTLQQRISQLIPATAPVSPERVAATAGNGFVDVSFNPPVDDGGTPVTSYTIKASTGQTMNLSAAEFAKTGFLRFPVADKGHAVTFIASAVNNTGTSPPLLPSIPVTVPGETLQRPESPGHVSAESGSHGEVSIQFQATADQQKESDAGVITAYVVTVQPVGARQSSVPAAIRTTPRPAYFQRDDGEVPPSDRKVRE